MKFILCISFLLLMQTGAFSQWQQTSGPSGGGVSEFTFVNGTILTATYDLGNGVFASTDSGTSWHESGLQGVMLNHIAASGNTVIASSTENSYNETDTIYRSSDGGASWQIVRFVSNGDTTMGIIPNINGVKSICSHNKTWFLSSQGEAGGMYSSVDDGATWSSFKPSFNFSYPVILISAGIYILAGTTEGDHIQIFNSTDGTIWDTTSFINLSLIPSTEIYCGAAIGNTILFGITGGIIYSQDGGKSWTQPSIGVLTTKSEYVTCIAGSGNNIVAISSANNVFGSHDGGQTWQNLVGNGLPVNASFFFTLGFDAPRGMIYLGSSSGILRQSIFSNTWAYSSEGLRASSISDVAASGGNIFAVTERGVSYSSNTGTSWHDPQNLTDLNDVPIAGFFKGSSNFYAYGQGLYSWNGSSWNTVDTGQFIALCQIGSGRIFASRQNGDPITGTSGIDISDNAGTTWSNVLSFTNSFDTEYYFLPHCLSSNGSGVILDVQRANIFQTISQVFIVYRSSDNGFTWQQAGTVNSPAFVSFADDNSFYMGTYGNGLFRSVDNGLTWTKFSALASGIDVTSFLKIGNALFISVNGNGNSADGLYFSTNSGSSWVYANYGNPDIFGPLATDGTYIYSGGPSVWRRQLQGLGVHDTKMVQDNIPLEIYPNPAADMIHLHFASPGPLDGILLIYDEKGMAVSKQAISEDGNAEDRQLSLSGISEGVYYAKLTDRNGIEMATARFVVQRK